MLIDARVAIAHNMVMAIDGKHVITGSCNFTRSAPSSNIATALVVADDAGRLIAYTPERQPAGSNITPTAPDKGWL